MARFVGKETRSFDDRLEAGMFISRLTVVRGNGSLRAFEARDTDLETARQKVSELASAASRGSHPIKERPMFYPHVSQGSAPVIVTVWPRGQRTTARGLRGRGGRVAQLSHNFARSAPNDRQHSTIYENMRPPFSLNMPPMPGKMALPHHNKHRQTHPQVDILQQQLWNASHPTITNITNVDGARPIWLPSDQIPSRPPAESSSHAQKVQLRSSGEIQQNSDGAANKRRLHIHPGGLNFEESSPASKKRIVDYAPPSLIVGSESKGAPARIFPSSYRLTKRTQVEEDAGDEIGNNYVTTLNELCQRGVAGLRDLKCMYTELSSASKSAKWQCTGTTAAIPVGGGDPVTLSKAVFGKSKRACRHIAAKELLADLVRRNIVTQDTVAAKGANLASLRRMQRAGFSALSPEENAQNAAAVSILNQLWQKEKFLCKPKCTLLEISSGATMRWRAVIFIKTADFGDIEADGISGKRRAAKQMAAFQALKKLKELNFPGIDKINVHAKPQKLITSQPPEQIEQELFQEDDEDTLDEAIRHRLDNEVKGDGDVGATAGGGAAKSAMFAIPPNCSTKMARCAEDVDLWIADHVTDGTALGICIDSSAARQEFEKDTAQAARDVALCAFQADECRAIALCSTSSALLVSAHFMGDPRTTPIIQDEYSSIDRTTGATTTNPGNDNSNVSSSLPVDASSCGQSWIPKPLKVLLEREECPKFGIVLREGCLALRLCHGIQCMGMRELSDISNFVTDTTITNTASTMARQWLRQELFPHAADFPSSASELSYAAASTKDASAAGLFVAAACQTILTRIEKECERKRRNVFGSQHVCEELCNRLMKPLRNLQAPYKNRAFALT